MQMSLNLSFFVIFVESFACGGGYQVLEFHRIGSCRERLTNLSNE